MTRPLPRFLAQRADAGMPHLQHHDLPRWGISEGQLRLWLREGHLARVCRGSYVIEAPVAEDNAWVRDRIRYRRRCAAVLGGMPNAYLVASSAAVAYDLPVLAVPRTVHLSVRPYARHERPGISVHRPWSIGTPQLVPGMPTQPVAETVVDVSAALGVEAGLIVADAALHRRLLERAEMTEAIERFGHRTGVRYARTVADLADARAESAGESRTRWCLHGLGYDLEPQVEIRDGCGRFVARGDFLVEGTRVIVEFDGLERYTDPESLRAEKVRQMALERLGYLVVRLRWADLDHPERIAAVLGRVLTNAA